MIAHVKRYTIDDFIKIMVKKFTYTLPEHVNEKIKSLIKNIDETMKQNKINPINITRRNRLSDEHWNNIRNFKETHINKSEGIYKTFDNIRNILNKITEESYENNKTQIFNYIDSIEDCEDIKNIESKEEIYNKLEKIIFDIISNNSFYSYIYAILYRDLLEKYKFLKVNFDKNLKKFENIFNKQIELNFDNDYEKLCSINKMNDSRIALCEFYINLMKIDILDKSVINNMIVKLQNNIIEYIKQENNITQIEEITEILYLLVVNSNDEISSMENYSNIIDNIIKITQIKKKEVSSISNKIIFKHMDILDEIN